MREGPRAKVWRSGNDLIVLSEVIAVNTYSPATVEIQLKNGSMITCRFGESRGDEMRAYVKSLNDAVEQHHLEGL